MHKKRRSPWWQSGVIYQIYPKSFQASGDKSTGDLKGIIQRLDYLQKLGIAAILLTPIYPSPHIENGCDVADYCAIDATYGTIDEFEQLVEQAHRRNIHIILDMVFNHTSIAHDWFRQAITEVNSPYHDFYIWHAGKPNIPPNHWQSKMGGSAWQWHADVGKYYLHLYSWQQADLNWENRQVREALKQVCHFWADLGVDGFRVDVMNLLSKVQHFSNEENGSDGYCFYPDEPHIYEYLQEFQRDIFKPRKLMSLGDMSLTALAYAQQYSALTGEALSMTCNSHHLKVDYPNGEKWRLAAPDFIALKSIFNQWQQGMYNQAWNALFWCNHDQPRIVSRFGEEGKYRTTSAKMWAMVLHGLQGTPYIYQGEEIGMTNPHFSSIDDYRDVESLNMYNLLLSKGALADELLVILAARSRDNSRTPMQWDSSTNAGFTQGEPWIEMCDNYGKINVKKALQTYESIFYTYQKLIELRKQHLLFTFGDYHDLLPLHRYLWCYRRQWKEETLVVAANLSHKNQIWEPLVEQEHHWHCLLSNYNNPPMMSAELVLRPFEALFWITI